MPETPVPIYDLPAVSDIDGTISFPVDQEGTAKRILINDLKTNFTDTIRVELDDDINEAIDEWFATHEIEENGKLCVIDGTGSTFTSNMTYAELYKTLVTDNQSVVFLFIDDTSEYVTAFAQADSGEIKIVFILPKDSIYKTFPVIYVSISNADVINISTDSILGVGAVNVGNSVVLTMDENLRVFDQSNATIKGSQINALAADKKAVFLWDIDNERLFTYSYPEGSGAAVFCAPTERASDVFVIKVNATSNAATFSNPSVLPYVTESDNGKILGVVNGAFGLIDLMSTIDALEARIEALENQ